MLHVLISTLPSKASDAKHLEKDTEEGQPVRVRHLNLTFLVSSVSARSFAAVRRHSWDRCWDRCEGTLLHRGEELEVNGLGQHKKLVFRYASTRKNINVPISRNPNLISRTNLGQKSIIDMSLATDNRKMIWR